MNRRYTNLTREMKYVLFVDGSAQFLKRGNTFTSDKATSVIQSGIAVEEIQEVKSKKAAATSEA